MIGDYEPRLRILLVEDNPVSLQVAQALLAQLGHSVTCCADGRQAVEAIDEGDYHLVLMDIGMPVLDGVEATRHIRRLADPRKSGIPIYALTANASGQDTDRYLAAGMNGVMQKPIRKADLDEALRLLSARGFYVAGGSSPGQEIFDDRRMAALSDAVGHAKALELFEMARLSIIEATSALRQHCHSGDTVGAAKMAHRLAGVAANFGYSALHRVAADIERDFKDGGTGMALLNSLDNVLAASLTALPGQSR